jgi:hypothetical protein
VTRESTMSISRSADCPDPLVLMASAAACRGSVSFCPLHTTESPVGNAREKRSDASGLSFGVASTNARSASIASLDSMALSLMEPGKGSHSRCCGRRSSNIPHNHIITIRLDRQGCLVDWEVESLDVREAPIATGVRSYPSPSGRLPALAGPATEPRRRCRGDATYRYIIYTVAQQLVIGQLPY